MKGILVFRGMKLALMALAWIAGKKEGQAAMPYEIRSN